MKIREYAQKVGHKVVGKLTRIPEKEMVRDSLTGEFSHGKAKFYTDEAGNEYYVEGSNVCIVTSEGGII